jgi:hypothetical protein
MSYVIAAPEMMTYAATDLATIGSTLRAAHLAAAAPTVAVLPAAADEVSAGIAHLFSSCAQDYHSLAGRVAAFHEQFVQHLTAGAASYASTEAANVTLQQMLQDLTPIADRIGSAISTLGADLLKNYVTASTGWFDGLFQNFLENPIGFVLDLPFIIPDIAILLIIISLGVASGVIDPTTL